MNRVVYLLFVKLRSEQQLPALASPMKREILDNTGLLKKVDVREILV